VLLSPQETQAPAKNTAVNDNNLRNLRKKTEHKYLQVAFKARVVNVSCIVLIGPVDIKRGVSKLRPQELQIPLQDPSANLFFSRKTFLLGKFDISANSVHAVSSSVDEISMEEVLTVVESSLILSLSLPKLPLRFSLLLLESSTHTFHTTQMKTEK
jgi:hypothetical protein